MYQIPPFYTPFEPFPFLLANLDEVYDCVRIFENCVTGSFAQFKSRTRGAAEPKLNGNLEFQSVSAPLRGADEGQRVPPRLGASSSKAARPLKRGGRGGCLYSDCGRRPRARPLQTWSPGRGRGGLASTGQERMGYYCWPLSRCLTSAPFARGATRRTTTGESLRTLPRGTGRPVPPARAKTTPRRTFEFSSSSSSLVCQQKPDSEPTPAPPSSSSATASRASPARSAA